MSNKDQKIKKAIQYYQENYQNLHQEFLNLLRIPSVSTSEDHQDDIQKAADFLVEKLSGLGFDKVSKHSTPKHPIVYGEYIVDSEKPTVLIYGHYDVQPPDPLNDWHTPPFEPAERGEYLFARGASDMKGQIWATISALEAIIKAGQPGLNIKLLFEGEEEIGSPSLDAFLESHKALLKSDFVLNPDAGMIAPDKPTIIDGLRGLAYFELRIFGPKADLHSGIFGGVVANPANVLCKLIAGMHDENGKVTLPGFYDHVRDLTENEREELSRIGFDDNFYKEMTGVSALNGEMGYTPVERAGARPTLDVNGFYSGYIEKGAKTIIPAYATAKISTRLVPNQDPILVHEGMKSYLEANVPDTVTWELEYMSGAPAYINGEETPGLELFIEALNQTWHMQPLMKREGGSIPVATSMKEILGVDSIITGFGLPGDQIHSPNERLHLPTHRKGVEALIRFFA
ncbi:MAG: Putative M20 family peptidase [Anaerolinea thermophila]|uniref:Putative M20 family peptidase n=1 Tax=Anaerolinea thermophila TaxID=167964 RepID=A0A101FX02_9CHLR|nr:MAG: Putative M20 family peptidase [Anaerolinea thermophila]